jgi:hypothetical protein
MPALFFYFLKLSATLAILWLFYYAILRPLTFHTWNRWYLLGYSLLSFFIPLIDLGSLVKDNAETHQPAYFTYIPALGNYAPAIAHPYVTQTTGVDGWTLCGLVLAGGILFLLTRTLIRWLSLIRIQKQARLIRDKAIRIYQVDRDITPFSFGNAIYINTQLHTEKEWEEIILHEYVHIRQYHTLDILVAEAVCILNWYNPFAWALRHSIRQNLEFIADQQVLDNGIDKKEYQYHLLKVIGQSQYRLANNFNFSSLKKRIIMMNKIRSARLHLLRFLFLLPLLAVVLLAFRTRSPQLPHGNKGIVVNAVGIAIGLPDKKPLAGVAVRDKRTGLQGITDANGYYKLTIPVSADSMRVHLDFSKDGYETTFTERFWPAITQTQGLIGIAGLTTLAPHGQEFFMAAPSFQALPPDPDYSDAAAELERVLTLNRQIDHLQSVQAAHPGISSFYVTEDKKRRLVIHTDGSVERYGYPATPGLNEMDKKYGPLPSYMTQNQVPVNTGYLDRWAAISAQAEKEFHPTGGDPKVILFPGDSRIVVVDAAGKTQIYDMDNTVDAKERPAFEKLYGKLPACVPESGAVPSASLSRSPKPAPAVDTVPDSTHHASVVLTLPPAVRVYLPKKQPIYVIDDIVMPDSMNVLQHLDAADIASVRVLKNEPASSKYGPDAPTRGVILIDLKKELHLKTDLDLKKTQKQP